MRPRGRTSMASGGGFGRLFPMRSAALSFAWLATSATNLSVASATSFSLLSRSIVTRNQWHSLEFGALRATFRHRCVFERHSMNAHSRVVALDAAELQVPLNDFRRHLPIREMRAQSTRQTE